MKLYRFNELKVYQALQDKNKFNISEDLYYRLICADPTNKPNYKELQLDINDLDIEKVKEINQGKYFQWVIKQYKDKERIFLEDFNKIYSTLELFNKFNTKLQNKDINQYKDLGSIYNVVKQFDPDNQEVEFTNEDEQKLIGQFKVVFKNDYCRIIIPLTLEASKYFAQGTEWCTQYPNEFIKYTKSQTLDITEHNLYIIYTENPEDRLQFHFKERQFMDIDDSSIKIQHFMEDHKDIYDFFNKTIKVNKFIKTTYWIDYNFDSCPPIIEGDFICFNCNLTTLEGNPHIIDGDFECSHNKLITLKGGPHTVNGSYHCASNQLINLKGAPKIIEGDFNCMSNKLTTLEGGPQTVEGDFDCSNNQLTTLEGAPQTVEGDFYCYYNPNLSREEILRYKATGAVQGTIMMNFK